MQKRDPVTRSKPRRSEPLQTVPTGRPVRLRALLFLILLFVSVTPVLILAFLYERPALQKELDAVQEKHLLLAQDLGVALNQYARDTARVFEAATAMLDEQGSIRPLADLLRELRFRHICIFDDEGTLIRSLALVADTAEAAPAYRALLDQQAGRLQPGQVLWTPVMRGTQGLPALYLLMEIGNGNRAVAELATDRVIELQRSVTFGRKGHAVIVDQVGRVLAHPRENWRLEIRDLSALEPVSLMMNGEFGVTTFFSPAIEQDMVVGFATVAETGWGVMVPQPLTELEESARGLVGVTLTISLLATLVAGLLSWWLAGLVARPLITVANAARGMSRGEPTAPIRLGRVPLELRSLAESFNSMVKEVLQAGTRLRASEARFRDFASTAADWFWETDTQHHFTYLSERYGESTGNLAIRSLGSSMEEIFPEHPENRDALLLYRQAIEHRQPFDSLQLTWDHVDGGQRILHISGQPFSDQFGRFQGYRGTGRDITTAHRLSEQLSHEASHDALTDLMNRREFESRVASELEDLHQTGAQHALCFLDLDQFKLVNDTSGHVAGDELLRQLGTLLREHLRRGDLVARLGGDEFGILLMNCSIDQAQRLAKGLRNVVSEFRFNWEDKVFAIGASIGLVAVSRGSGDIGRVLRQADAACYAAKEGGRNLVHVYRDDDEEQVKRQGELRWVQRLNTAMEQETLMLYCQQIVPLQNAADHSFRCEILVRMKSPSGELIPAGQFLPAAERYNLATRIDLFVIHKTFDWFRQHPGAAEAFSLCTINLSGQSLGNETIAEHLDELLRSSSIDPRKICFEITETAAIANLSNASRLIGSLRNRGCLFALDDFGSGLSSFAYLKTLPVDFLKIDGAFVRDIADDPVDLTMVKSINEMAHALGKKTIAEFVESQAVLDLLTGMGVDFAQGLHIGPPRPLDEQRDAGRSNLYPRFNQSA